MINLLCVFFAILIAAQGALLMADVYSLARQCIKLPEVNGTEDDVNDLLMGYLPDSKSGKCMLRCMETRVGILENDKYSIKGTYMFFRNHFPENPYNNNMEQGVRFCDKIVQKRANITMDRCQYAHMVAACIKRRIKYVPGCRAAFYNPFVWKDPFKKATIKPVKKYFEVKRRYIQRESFEIVTKPQKKYTLDDAEGVLISSESEAGVWSPPRERKGKWTKAKRNEKKNKKGSDSDLSLDEDSGEDSSLDKSSKTRRHQKKQFRI